MTDRTRNVSQPTTSQTITQGDTAMHTFEWTQPTVQGEALAPVPAAAACVCSCTGSAGAGAGAGRLTQ